MDNFIYMLNQQEFPQLSTPNRPKGLYESLDKPLLPMLPESSIESSRQVIRIINDKTGETNFEKLIRFDSKIGWNSLKKKNEKILDQLIKYQQQVFTIFQNHSIRNQVYREFFQASLDNLQGQNQNLIIKLQQKRQMINNIKKYSLEKSIKIGKLLVKQNNLRILKEKISALKTTKTKVYQMKQYHEVLFHLKTRRKSPKQKMPVSQSPMNFKIYKPLHQNRLVQLMKNQITNVKVSQYQWKEDDSFILTKIVGIVLRSGLQISQDNFSISSICNNYMKLKKCLKIQKKSQNVIQEALRGKLISVLISNLSEPQNNKVSYQIYMEAKKIMSQNQEQNKFFDQIIEGYEKAKKTEFSNFKDQLLSISWQGLSQIEIFNWIENFRNKYSWLQQNGIQSELEEIRIIITKKIIRPLLIDFLHIEKIWHGLVFFGTSIEVLDLNRFNEKDLHKNQIKQYHAYRIWHKYQNIYHKIHPFVNDSPISMLSVDITQKQIAVLKQKKSAPKMIILQQEVLSQNIIDYLQYSSLICSLWSGKPQQQQIAQLWSQLIAEYFLRKAPHLLCELSSKQYILYSQTIKKYEQISSISSKQAYLQGYLTQQKLNQVQQQEMYNYVMKYKFSSFNKEFLEKCAQKIECFQDLKKMREGVYNFFNCSYCKKWKY